MTDTDDLEILTATAEGLGHTLASHRLLQESISGDGIVRAYEVELELDADSSAPGATDGTDGIGDADTSPSRVTQVIYLETSPGARDRDDVLVFRNEETDEKVAVWLYPKDPALPALPTVVYPQAAAVILRKMGIEPSGLALELVAYRPGRRAVVRMATQRGNVFMKVMRPRQITELHERYQTWEQAGVPVPPTLGWTDDGLLGFAALPGVPSHTVIEKLDDAFLDAVEALTEHYAQVASETAARTSLAERRAWYVRRIARMHPDLTARVDALDERIGHRLRRSTAGPPVTVHSDLHLGQIFVDPENPETVTGILDIDTAGLGDPADDAGAMYAHMLVSAEFATVQGQTTGAAFERLAESWRRRWDRRGAAFVERAEAIAAAHLIAHGIGGLVPAATLVSRAETFLQRTQ